MGLFRGVTINFIISKHISNQKHSSEEQDLAEIVSTNFSSARCNCSYPSSQQLLAHELPGQQRHKSKSSFSWTAILEKKMEGKKNEKRKEKMKKKVQITLEEKHPPLFFAYPIILHILNFWQTCDCLHTPISLTDNCRISNQKLPICHVSQVLNSHRN